MDNDRKIEKDRSSSEIPKWLGFETKQYNGHRHHETSKTQILLEVLREQIRSQHHLRKDRLWLVLCKQLSALSFFRFQP